MKSIVAGGLLTVMIVWAQQDKSGAEKGKAAMERLCIGCHDLDQVTDNRKTAAGWQSTVDAMVARGADGTEEELAAVVQYLAKNFGKLNVNAATPEEMRDFLGIAEQDARAIAGWRDRNGDFKNFDQLKAVPNIDGARLQEKRQLIAFSQ